MSISISTSTSTSISISICTCTCSLLISAACWPVCTFKTLKRAWACCSSTAVAGFSMNEWPTFWMCVTACVRVRIGVLVLASQKFSKSSETPGHLFENTHIKWVGARETARLTLWFVLMGQTCLRLVVQRATTLYFRLRCPTSIFFHKYAPTVLFFGPKLRLVGAYSWKKNSIFAERNHKTQR